MQTVSDGIRGEHTNQKHNATSHPRAGLSGEGLRLGGLYLEGTVGMKGDLDRDRRLDLGDGDGERERGEAEREDRR